MKLERISREVYGKTKKIIVDMTAVDSQEDGSSEGKYLKLLLSFL